MERCTECIAYDLKDVTMIGFNGAAQNVMMPRPRGFPCIGVLARQLGTAFDVREEESDRTGGKIVDQIFLPSRSMRLDHDILQTKVAQRIHS